MSTPEKILEEAISLTPIEQARLVDRLIAVLDKPDLEIDKLWATEAESRLSAFKAGKLKSVTLENVLSKTLRRAQARPITRDLFREFG